MKISNLKKINWYKDKERDIDILFESIYLTGFGRGYFKRIKFDYEVAHSLAFSDGSIYYDRNAITAGKNIFLRRPDHVGRLAETVTQAFLLKAENYLTFLKKFRGSAIPQLSRMRLLKLSNEYLEKLYCLIPYSTVISILFEEVAREIVQQSLKENGIAANRYAELAVAYRRNYTSQEYQQRLKIALKYKKSLSKENFKKDLQKHALRYSWISCYSPVDPPQKFSRFEKETLELARRGDLREEIRKAGNKLREQLRISNSLLKKSRLPRQVIEIVKAIRKNVWVRTYRREIMSYGFCKMRPLFLRWAAELGINLTELKYLATWEILELLKQGRKAPKKLLDGRKKGFVMILFDDIITVASSEQAVKIKKLLAKDSEAPSFLSGEVVQAGKVRGVVQVVKSRPDVKKFKKGRILVAHTVATWMLPAVQNCLAIITDAGGVLAHTAILAREYRKPCLVNTRHATRLLRTGDLVNMNTETNQIIKIV